MQTHCVMLVLTMAATFTEWDHLVDALDHRYVTFEAVTKVTTQLSQDFCTTYWNHTTVPCIFLHKYAGATLEYLASQIVDAAQFVDSVSSQRKDVPAWHGAGGQFSDITERLRTEYADTAILAAQNGRYPEARVLIGQTLHLLQHNAVDNETLSIHLSVEFLNSIKTAATVTNFAQLLGLRLQRDLVIVVDVSEENAIHRLEAIKRRLSESDNTGFDLLNDASNIGLIRIIVVSFTKTQIQPALAFNSSRLAQDHIGKLISDCSAKVGICSETVLAGEFSAMPLRAARTAAELADTLSTIFLFSSQEIDDRVQHRLHIAVLMHKQQELVVIGSRDSNTGTTYGNNRYHDTAQKTGGYAVFFPETPDRLYAATELFNQHTRAKVTFPFCNFNNENKLQLEVPLQISHNYRTFVECRIGGPMASSFIVRILDSNGAVVNASVTGNDTSTLWVEFVALPMVAYSVNVEATKPGWYLKCYDTSAPGEHYMGLYRKETFRDPPTYVSLQGQPLIGETLTVLVRGIVASESDLPVLEILSITGVDTLATAPFARSKEKSLEYYADFEVPASPFWVKVSHPERYQYHDRPLLPTIFNASLDFFRPVEFLPPGGFVKLYHQFTTNDSYFVQLSVDDSFGYREPGQWSDIEHGGFGGDHLFYGTSNITIPNDAPLGSVDYVVFMLSSLTYQEETYAVQPILIANGSKPFPPSCRILTTDYYDECSQHFPVSLDCRNRLWQATVVFVDEYDAFAYSDIITLYDVRFNGTGFQEGTAMAPTLHIPNRTVMYTSNCCAVERRLHGEDSNGVEGAACVLRHPQYTGVNPVPSSQSGKRATKLSVFTTLAAFLVQCIILFKVENA
ncbi:uncharacterized protein LOC129602775 [Paramacrobiotus metropolitanus]|uniref:uncharacterized protein LOC129602775 n=1 Tax=Paramacrobiotus metropolitanus TaxID=2943436 RepID=UPI0024456271|nr:uncharacterized protein LOC129602775 [Paramacrobiotus metropolitanus]